MNKTPSREFQLNYQRLDEPVTVMARSRTLGTWYPKGTEPNSADAADCVAYEAEIKYLKFELAKRLVTKVESTSPVETFAPKTAVRADVRNGGFGHSTPAPKGK